MAIFFHHQFVSQRFALLLFDFLERGWGLFLSFQRADIGQHPLLAMAGAHFDEVLTAL